jgi:hypothetical protein
MSDALLATESRTAASCKVTLAFPAFPGNLPVQSRGLAELADALD